MTVDQAKAKKLLTAQQLRLHQCNVEIAQFEDQIANAELMVLLGITPIVPVEMLERMVSEPRSRKVGIQTELDALAVAIGG